MYVDFQRFCTSSPNLWRTTRSSSFLPQPVGFSCCDTEAFLAASTHKPHAFPGTTYPRQCDNFMPPSQAPNPPRRERPHHQSIQPDDVQRTVAHTVFARNTPMRRFRPQTKLHPHFSTLDSLGSRIFTCLLNLEFDNHSIQLFTLPLLGAFR